MQKLISKIHLLWAAFLLSLSNGLRWILTKATQSEGVVIYPTERTPEAFLDSGQVKVPAFVKGREARIQWVYRSFPKSFWL